ncbi:MAG: D-aminoacyl-tRNA deacylase [Candidatus Nanopelagicales bacterium]|nr:D-aminoacyl-tRNA deacylase [Candidatus Nanopelagicales bacterium]
MRAIVQRAIDANVLVSHQIIGAFAGPGLVIFVGVTHTDSLSVAHTLAKKIYGLRIFDQGFVSQFDQLCVPPSSSRELSAGELGLPMLVISQFTLYASTKKGRRPTWDLAAPREVAEPLVEAVAQKLRELGTDVSQGKFGTDMQVSLTNAGPMTLIIDVD